MKTKSVILAILIVGIIDTGNANYPPGKEALYYGFFFNSTIANSIQTVAETYFTECVNNIPEFKQFVESAAKDANISNIFNYFTKPLDPNTQSFDPYYHVTTKFCGESDCSAYRKRVQPSLNQPFEIHLVGYYFTKRSFGIRINLTESQEETVFDNYRSNPRNSVQDDEAITIITALPNIKFENIPLTFTPTDTKAHITIGCAPNISAEITGSDLMEIIEIEKNTPPTPTNTYPFSIQNGDLSGFNVTVVYYNNGSNPFGDAFVIYPSMKILASSNFEPYLKPLQSSANVSTFLTKLLTILFISVIVMQH